MLNPRIGFYLQVDGVLCDGAGKVDFGWSWFSSFGSVRGADAMAVATDYGGTLWRGFVYTRMLTTSEQVANFRALAHLTR